MTKSPKHLDDNYDNPEMTMTTQISTKLAALSVALLVNGVMFGSVAYLFNGQLHAHAPETIVVQAPMKTPARARV